MVTRCYRASAPKAWKSFDISSFYSRTIPSHEKSCFELKIAPFQRRALSVGEVIHAASDLQFSVGRVSAMDGSSVTVDWESPFWIRTDGSSRALIVQLDATPMRVMGTAIGIESIG